MSKLEKLKSHFLKAPADKLSTAPLLPFCVICCSIGIGFAAYYYFEFNASFGAMILLSGVVLSTIPTLLAYFTKRYLLPAHLAVLFYNFVVCFLTSSTGGIHGVTAWWLCATPVLAAFLLNTATTIFWAIVSLLQMFLITYLERIDSLPTNELAGQDIDYLATTSIAGLLGLLTGMMLVEDRYKAKQIKENEQLTKSNQQQSVLASLGELSTGIAHEINNPLAIIHAQAEVIKRKLAKEGEGSQERIEDSIEVIQLTVERISKIVRGMKRLGHQDLEQDEKSSVTLSQILEDSLGLVENKAKLNEINLQVKDSKNNLERLVYVSEVQISQILINLIMNAIDAIEALPKKWIRIEVSRDDIHIKISIIDAGPGISEDQANKIFEPFYTTKGVGKGTGLGLSLSKSLAKSNGGDLTIDTKAVNTTFELHLPKDAVKKAA